MSKIKILLNGEEKFFDRAISIESLIVSLELDIKKIAVEKNLEIIMPEDFAGNVLANGDRVEIVHFIGGG